MNNVGCGIAATAWDAGTGPPELDWGRCMAEILDLNHLELPDCEKCRDPSKRIFARTMDLEGPGVPGVLYQCNNKKCRSRRNVIGNFLFMGEER